MRPTREHIQTGSERSMYVQHSSGPGWGFNWHFHPEHELTLILRGSGQRFVGDDIADFHAGDLVLLGANLPHTWYSRRPVRNPPHEAIVVQFMADFLGDGFFDRPETGGIGRLLRRSGQGIQFRGRVAEVASARLARVRKLRPLERVTELLAILDMLTRCRSVRVLSSARFKPPQRPREQRRIHRTLQFVHENIARADLSLREAAERARLSPSAFSRFFRRASGKGFSRYVNELRIGRACELLAETDRNIAIIALDCGFENLSNFNRRFKQLRDLRPREYRRRFQAIE
jgi:AraC-like DNA-binding protein